MKKGSKYTNVDNLEVLRKEFVKFHAEEMAKAREVIEFYGNKCFVPRSGEFIDWCTCHDIEEVQESCGNIYKKGGKQARQYLKENPPVTPRARS